MPQPPHPDTETCPPPATGPGPHAPLPEAAPPAAPRSPASAGPGAAPAPGAHSRLVVAAAVVDRLSKPTRLLCAARAYPAELAGRFELPGGKVEPGESPLQALTRELAEEISLRVRLGDELHPPADLAVPAPISPPGPAPSSPADQHRTRPPAPDGLDRAPAWPAMKGYRIRVWLAEPADPEDRGTAGDDHLHLQWTPVDRLGELDWLEADIPIAQAIQALTSCRAPGPHAGPAIS